MFFCRSSFSALKAHRPSIDYSSHSPSPFYISIFFNNLFIFFHLCSSFPIPFFLFPLSCLHPGLISTSLPVIFLFWSFFNGGWGSLQFQSEWMWWTQFPEGWHPEGESACNSSLWTLVWYYKDYSLHAEICRRYLISVCIGVLANISDWISEWIGGGLCSWADCGRVQCKIILYPSFTDKA